MQLVLVGAAVVSVVALDEWHTAIVLFAVTLLTAILGLNQEGKAVESVAPLQKMLVLKVHVRRGGGVIDIPADELVPGDVVSFEAGDKITADGRLLVAAMLEIEGATLTGESMPVPKEDKDEDAAIGDRVDMAHMNSTVTHGRREMIVTATGMGTEVGVISAMLSADEQEKTPLTRQLDQLTIVVAWLARIAIRLSRATLRTIKQSPAWPFGYNVAALPSAAAGLLNCVSPAWRSPRPASRSSPTRCACGASVPPTRRQPDAPYRAHRDRRRHRQGRRAPRRAGKPRRQARTDDPDDGQRAGRAARLPGPQPGRQAQPHRPAHRRAHQPRRP
jgi:cation transport ATPase